MKTSFARTFVALRRQAGFDTAYQFFHKNGGAKVFGCSFSNYLRIEKGSHLPQPKRLPLLCSLLRLPLKSDDLRRLSRAYLETWTGSEELAHWLLTPFEGPATSEPPPEPARQALAKIVSESARPVTLRQFEAVMEKAASYWCYRVLTSSREAYRPEELAALLQLKTRDVQDALKGLAREKLASRLSDGRYRSDLAGEFLVFPDSNLVAPELMQRVFRYNEEMIAKRGSVVDVRYCGVRADLWKLQGFIPHFREAIRSVNAYAVAEKTEHSALVFVEGRIVKLFDF